MPLSITVEEMLGTKVILNLKAEERETFALGFNVPAYVTQTSTNICMGHCSWPKRPTHGRAGRFHL